MWTSIEGNTGIICACLLCLKPLIVKLFPSLLSESNSPSNNIHLPTFHHRLRSRSNKVPSIASSTAVGSSDTSTAKTALQHQSPSASPIHIVHPRDDIPLRTSKESSQLESSKRIRPLTSRNDSFVSLALNSSQKHHQSTLEMPKLSSTLDALPNPCITTISACPLPNLSTRSIPGSISVNTEVVRTSEYFAPAPSRITAFDTAESVDGQSHVDKSSPYDVPDLEIDWSLLETL